MHEFRVIVAVAVVAGLLAGAGVVQADAIQKWRTPNGTLYFGDRPPAGSVLIETFLDSPVPTVAVAPPAEDPGFARAAAEGRDIIRRREAERADARREEETVALLEAREEAEDVGDPWLWIVSTSFERPCLRPPRSRHHHHHDSFPSDIFRRSTPREPRVWRSGASSRFPTPAGYAPRSRRTSSIGRSLQ